jgi:phosphatidylglycerol lysyltransferase
MVETELIRYGYLVLFAGVAVEGDAFLLAAAFLAHRGYLSLGWVIVVSAFATLTADQIYYQLARWRGREAFARRAAGDPRFARVRLWLEKRGTLLLFLSRFMYGFRIAIPVSCGAIGMPAGRFTAVNLAGSLIWAAVFGLAGYAFGNALEVVVADLVAYERVIAVVLLVVSAVVVALRSHELKARILALRAPSEAALQLAGRLFAAAHGAGRLLLARPHVRLAAFVVAIGALNILTAVFHWRFVPLDVLDGWLPIEVRQLSRAALLLSGLALVTIGRGLSRRKRAAWTVAATLAALSVVLHLGHYASVVRAAVSALLVVELVRQEHRFHARTDPVRLRNALVAIPVLAFALTAYGTVGYLRFDRGLDTGTAARLTWQAAALQPPLLQPTAAGHTARGATAFGWSIALLSVVSGVYVFGALLAPVAWRREAAADLQEVARLAATHGRDSMSYFAKQDDKTHARTGLETFVGYRVVRRVAVVAGDPVGPDGSVPDAIAAFTRTCERNDWVPVFYETSGRYLDAYAARGLRWFKVAEEAVIPLAGFSLSGSKIAKVRHGVAKAEREAPGITVWEYRPDARDPDVDEQLEDVSAEWLRAKGSGELGFNLGVFSVDDLADKRTIVASHPDGYVWAFLTWLPYRQGRALVLDAMRRRAGAPASVMDLLIARSALLFKDAGLEAISLGAAPMANAEDPANPSVYDRGVRLIFDHVSAVYGYRSLFHFKKKFNPTWESRYLVFPRPDLLPRIAYALAAVHVEGGLAAAAWRLVASRFERPRDGQQEAGEGTA